MTEYRGYRILPAKNMVGYELQHVGRGSIHSSLSGLFTNVKIAKGLIDDYLKTKEGKEELDGETSSSSGSEQVQRRSYHRRKSTNNS